MRRIAFAVLAVALAVSSAGQAHALARARRREPDTYGCPRAPHLAQDVAPGSGRTVALTFDDGPGRSTGRILAILAREHVTATFFNLGVNEGGARATVRGEFRAGYALGDHTWDHADLARLDADRQAAEIDRERALQARITGVGSCLFRPPYGSADSTTFDLAAQRHLAVWDWSVDTEDWKAGGSGAPFWVHRITARAEAGVTQAHPVILMHNQPVGNPATVRALPAVIDFYRRHGYAFVDLNGNTGLPVISSLHRPDGRVSGGARVVIRGENFRDVTAVRFGRELATRFRVLSPRRIVTVAPAHPAGTYAVSVATRDHGRSGPAAAAQFRYVAPPRVTALRPSSGPTSGGQQLRIGGTGYVDVLAVRVGRHVVTPVRVAGSTAMWVTTPPHEAGTVDVVVRTRFGRSRHVPADRYTYVASG